MDLWTWFELRGLKDRLKSNAAISRIKARRITNLKLKTQEEINDLRQDDAFLSLLTASLIEILKEKGVLSMGELKKKMEEIDLRDGKKDSGLDPKKLKE